MVLLRALASLSHAIRTRLCFEPTASSRAGQPVLEVTLQYKARRHKIEALNDGRSIALSAKDAASSRRRGGIGRPAGLGVGIASSRGGLTVPRDGPARYPRGGSSLERWTPDDPRGGCLTVIRRVKGEYPPRIGGIRGVERGSMSSPRCKVRISVPISLSIPCGVLSCNSNLRGTCPS